MDFIWQLPTNFRTSVHLSKSPTWVYAPKNQRGDEAGLSVSGRLSLTSMGSLDEIEQRVHLLCNTHARNAGGVVSMSGISFSEYLAREEGRQAEQGGSRLWSQRKVGMVPSKVAHIAAVA